MSDGLETLFSTLIYCAPFLVALTRRGKTLGLWHIFALDVLLGWTIVGWFMAWTMVFPQQLNFLPWLVHRLVGNRVPAGPAGAPGPGPLADPAAAQQRVCSGCGGGGTQTCSSCGGRGSWYEGPQGEHGTAQLMSCGACTSSGRVRCMVCGGSGRVW